MQVHYRWRNFYPSRNRTSFRAIPAPCTHWCKISRARYRVLESHLTSDTLKCFNILTCHYWLIFEISFHQTRAIAGEKISLASRVGRLDKTLKSLQQSALQVSQVPLSDPDASHVAATGSFDIADSAASQAGDVPEFASEIHALYAENQLLLSEISAFKQVPTTTSSTGINARSSSSQDTGSHHQTDFQIKLRLAKQDVSDRTRSELIAYQQALYERELVSAHQAWDCVCGIGLAMSCVFFYDQYPPQPPPPLLQVHSFPVVSCTAGNFFSFF